MIGFERASLDEGEAVREKATNDLLSTIHHVPVSDGCCLLRSLVPHAGKHKERGLTDSLEDTKKGAYCKNAGEVLACSMECQGRSPKDDVEREVFCDWYALNEPVGRIFNRQDSDVDTCRKPLVLYMLVCGAGRSDLSNLPFAHGQDRGLLGCP